MYYIPQINGTMLVDGLGSGFDFLKSQYSGSADDIFWPFIKGSKYLGPKFKFFVYFDFEANKNRIAKEIFVRCLGKIGLDLNC